MMYHDQTYGNLLRYILKTGNSRLDRTGTGTIGSFGHQMKFDLTYFPLLTGKKMPFKNTIRELLWFISGSTNVNDLHESVHNWWTPWSDEWGNLGPIYGKQFRAQETISVVKRKKFEVYKPDNMWEYGDNYNKHLNSEDAHLRNIWRDMMKRCYDINHSSFKSYGGKGIHVDPYWCVFTNFLKDVKKLPNYLAKKTYPNLFTLDKDILFGSNRYGPGACMWASKQNQPTTTSTTKPFTATHPNGTTYVFPSIGYMSSMWNVSTGAVHNCLNPNKNTWSHHGWSNFEYLNLSENDHLQCILTDQLLNVLVSIKENPTSRRHVMSLWNPIDMERAALPCCHGTAIQFYVNKGKYLDCQMYQRSADMFLGVPVNIASYSLLTHIVAQMTGYEPGVFVWTGGDCHIYKNHVKQCEEYLSRSFIRSPRVVLRDRGQTLDNWREDDIRLIGYDPHPGIKAPISV